VYLKGYDVDVRNASEIITTWANNSVLCHKAVPTVSLMVICRLQLRMSPATEQVEQRSLFAVCDLLGIHSERKDR
jgi:hypothetical protein